MTGRSDYYVYVHLRATDWIPFYVGMGHGIRAQTRSNRSQDWRQTEAACGCVVRILWEGLSKDEAYEKEIQAIRDIREYAPGSLTNISDGGLGGGKRRTGTDTHKEEIITFYKTFGRFPSSYRKDESGMNGRMRSYCNLSSALYDQEFRYLLESWGYGSNEKPPFVKEQVRERKEEIRDFVKENSRLPSRWAPEERYMYTRMTVYCNPSCAGFDPEFNTEMRALGFWSGRGRNKKEKV